MRRRRRLCVYVRKVHTASDGRRSRRSRVEAPNFDVFLVTAAVLRRVSALADASSVLADVPVGHFWPSLQLCAELVGSARKRSRAALESARIVVFSPL